MDNQVTLFVSGWINVEKDDLLLGKFNTKTMTLESVDPKPLTLEEITNAVKNGDLYVKFVSMLESGIANISDLEIDIDNLEIQED